MMARAGEEARADIMSALAALSTPSQGLEGKATVVGMAAAGSSPQVMVAASSVEDTGPVSFGPAVVGAPALGPPSMGEVSMIEVATETGGASEAPLVGPSQALVWSGHGPDSWDGSSLIFTDQSDPELVVFELDDVTEREEWRCVQGVFLDYQRAMHGALAMMGNELTSASQVGYRILSLRLAFPWVSPDRRMVHRPSRGEVG